MLAIKSTESKEGVFLWIGLTASAFLGNDALDDELDEKESASENVTRT